MRHCQRYRAAARMPQHIDTSTAHQGPGINLDAQKLAQHCTRNEHRKECPHPGIVMPGPLRPDQVPYPHRVDRCPGFAVDLRDNLRDHLIEHHFAVNEGAFHVRHALTSPSWPGAEQPAPRTVAHPPRCPNAPESFISYDPVRRRPRDDRAAELSGTAGRAQPYGGTT